MIHNKEGARKEKTPGAPQGMLSAGITHEMRWHPSIAHSI